MTFAKSYIFDELPIHMNLYEWPTPNPAPKPNRHWGLEKDLVKYVRIPWDSVDMSNGPLNDHFIVIYCNFGNLTAFNFMEQSRYLSTPPPPTSRKKNLTLK